MLRTALASLRYRTARLALSCLAIVLGVAFVSGTLVMGASMNQAYFTSFAAGRQERRRRRDPACARVPSSGQPGRPVGAACRCCPRSARPAGVESAAGRLVGQAPLVGRDGKVVRNGELPASASTSPRDPALRGFTVASGHLPGGPGQVAVDTATAADEHFRLGQTVKVVDHTGRIRSFRLVGTIDLGVDHEFGDATVTAFQTATGFAVTGRPGYDQIVARAAAGTSQAALTATIAALPGMSRYQVQTGSQLATSEANSAVHFTQQFTSAILVFALIALVVACIVIYNTFTILITQRGRELALLRCVGASRGQVFRQHPAGIGDRRADRVGRRRAGRARPRLGTAAAVRAGSAPACRRDRWSCRRRPWPSRWPPGLVVTVAAAVIPARSATRVAPVAALGGQHEQPARAGAGWLRVAAAVVCAGAGILATFTGLRHVSGDVRLRGDRRRRLPVLRWRCSRSGRSSCRRASRSSAGCRAG